jgi:hypothetical protein
MKGLLVSLWVAAAGCALYASCARAQQSEAIRSMQGCVALGMLVGTITDMRDIGGQRAKHIALIRERNVGEPLVELLVAEAERVYANPQKTHRELGGDAFERCMLGLQRKSG